MQRGERLHPLRDFLFQFNWSGWKTATGLGAPKPRGVNGGRDFDGDGQGDVYVVEHNFRAVVVFDRSGQYLGMLDRILEMNDPRASPWTRRPAT